MPMPLPLPLALALVPVLAPACACARAYVYACIAHWHASPLYRMGMLREYYVGVPLLLPIPECSQVVPRTLGALTLLNRENGTNPAAERSIPDLVGNGKRTNHIPAQGITTFPDFAYCRRPFVGIIACNQNSHSRLGKMRDCQFWKGQHHRSFRQFKFNVVSGNASNTNGFPTILARRAIGSMHRSSTHRLAKMLRPSHVRRCRILRFVQGFIANPASQRMRFLRFYTHRVGIACRHRNASISRCNTNPR